MTAATILKGAIAIAIFALVTYTMFRGQGFWWRLSKSSRVIFSAFAVLFIVAAGFFYKSQTGELHGTEHPRARAPDRAAPARPDR